MNWILAIIACLCIILYGWIQCNSPRISSHINKFRNQLNWTDIDNILSAADNGDLIFFSGDSRGEKTCKWFTGSIFSHVGILFRERNPLTREDILYIWDSDVGQKSKDGARVMALKDKLANYKGRRYIAWRKLDGFRPTTEKILSVVQKYMHLEFDHDMLSWFTSSGPLSIFATSRSGSVFCSELVAITLQELEIINKIRKAVWYSPSVFAKDLTLYLKEGYSYGAKTYSFF